MDHYPEAIVADLERGLGPGQARAEPLELALYSRDAGTERGRAVAVCFPRSTEDVAYAVQCAIRHGRSFVARGSGTGLAGGATPIDDPIVIVTTQMNRVLEVDADARVAWVEPGVLNLDLSRAVAPLGLHYAPDPSSQQACTIGGNVATNAGGPALPRRRRHLRARPGPRRRAGGRLGHPARRAGTGRTPASTCAAASSGSEGTMGIATRIAVRLQPDPPCVRTLLLDFTSIDDAAATVSAIIAAGIVPSALEMMDARITEAVEDFVARRLPPRRRGRAARRARRPAGGCRRSRCGRGPGRVASTAHATSGSRPTTAERALLWKGRKSAFGAIARITARLLPA